MHLSRTQQYTIQNRNVHISVRNGVLWDMGQVYCGMCKIGLFCTIGQLWDVELSRLTENTGMQSLANDIILDKSCQFEAHCKGFSLTLHPSWMPTFVDEMTSFKMADEIPWNIAAFQVLNKPQQAKWNQIYWIPVTGRSEGPHACTWAMMLRVCSHPMWSSSVL